MSHGRQLVILKSEVQCRVILRDRKIIGELQVPSTRGNRNDEGSHQRSGGRSPLQRKIIIGSVIPLFVAATALGIAVFPVVAS